MSPSTLRCGSTEIFFFMYAWYACAFDICMKLLLTYSHTYLLTYLLTHILTYLLTCSVSWFFAGREFSSRADCGGRSNSKTWSSASLETGWRWTDWTAESGNFFHVQRISFLTSQKTRLSTYFYARVWKKIIPIWFAQILRTRLQIVTRNVLFGPINDINDTFMKLSDAGCFRHPVQCRPTFYCCSVFNWYIAI